MSKNNKKKYSDDQLFGQDEYFYFIAGYTESGFAYGTTWEEAIADGLVDENRKPIKEEIVVDELYPF